MKDGLSHVWAYYLLVCLKVYIFQNDLLIFNAIVIFFTWEQLTNHDNYIFFHVFFPSLTQYTNEKKDEFDNLLFFLSAIKCIILFLK